MTWNWWYTLAARGLEEHDVRITLIFSKIISFMSFTCEFILFWRIVDRICWAYAIFRWTPNLQACTDRRTDRQTDELIRVGLGNLLFGSSRLTYSVPPCDVIHPTFHTLITFSSIKAPNNVASLDFDICACDSHAVYAPSFTLTPDPVVITQILTKPACRKSTRRGYGP